MKPDRNAPCPCGSGKKFKKCCGAHASRDPGSIADPLAPALEAFERGAWLQAEIACNLVLNKHPGNVDAQHLAGLIQARLGRYIQAHSFLEHAASLAPHNALIHSNLAMVLRELKRSDAAIRAAQQALAIDSELPEAQNNLANALKDKGDLAGAIQHYREAVAHEPSNEQYYENLLGALLEHDALDEAESFGQSLLHRFPESIAGNAGLGEVATRRGEWEAARMWLTKAVERGCRIPRVYHNLGVTYQGLRDYPQAFANFKQALAIDPKLGSVWHSVGLLFNLRENRPAALRAFNNAYELGMQTPEMKALLLDALSSQREVDRAHALAIPLINEAKTFPKILPILLSIFSITCDYVRLKSTWQQFDEAFASGALDPDTLASALLLASYSNYLTESRLLEYHQAWGREVAVDFHPKRLPINRARKIRLGYISPDFHEHSVSHFLMNVLAHQDRSQFELFCYSNSRARDTVTDFIESQVDHFIPVRDINDDELFELIQKQGIQILLDMAGHTSGHRLPLFARRPAPLQLTWIGYLHTTGLAAMDFRITDPYADDPDFPHGPEKLLVLPESFLCFGNFPDVTINPEPACVRTRAVTFASFNNLMKITDRAIELWSRILLAVPGSKMRIMATVTDAEVVRANLHAAFACQGVEADRIELHPPLPRKDYLAVHNDVDIVLDTFPFNGGTVTASALWMGTPVVTLVGSAHRQRVSYSMLKNIGVEETIAWSEGEYVNKAVRLAQDWPALAALRLRIAENIRRSILCNPERFTRQFDEALLKIWDEYCATESKLSGS